MFEGELRVIWTAAGERLPAGRPAGHLASLICQNLSERVETVMLNWVTVKGQILKTGIYAELVQLVISI